MAAITTQEELARDATGAGARMTKAVLKQCAVDNEGYESPELNDNLYLHFKGFRKIENLEEYPRTRADEILSCTLTARSDRAPLSICGSVRLVVQAGARPSRARRVSLTVFLVSLPVRPPQPILDTMRPRPP